MFASPLNSITSRKANRFCLVADLILLPLLLGLYIVYNKRIWRCVFCRYWSIIIAHSHRQIYVYLHILYIFKRRRKVGDNILARGAGGPEFAPGISCKVN